MFAFNANEKKERKETTLLTSHVHNTPLRCTRNIFLVCGQNTNDQKRQVQYTTNTQLDIVTWNFVVGTFPNINVNIKKYNNKHGDKQNNIGYNNNFVKNDNDIILITR